MDVCDDEPRCPPHRTVCDRRRPCRRTGAATARAAETAHRRRARVPGRGAGAAWRTKRTSLAANVLRPASAPVPVSAQTARLPQADQGRRRVDQHGHAVPGRAVPVLGRRPAAGRRHTHPVRRLPGDCQTLAAGRNRQLRLLRGAFPLVLGPEAVSDHHPGGHAGGLVSCRPEARRKRSRCRAFRTRPRHWCAPREDDRAGRQGACPAPNWSATAPTNWACCWYARTARTSSNAVTATSPGCANGSKPSTTPARTNSISKDTAAALSQVSTHASPSDYLHSLPWSGTTGRSTPTSNDRSSHTTTDPGWESLIQAGFA